MRKSLLNGATVLALASSFAIGSSVIPVLVPEPAAAADVVDCGMLAVGEPCVITHAEHPNPTQISIPANVPEVTAILSGASGSGGSDGQGAAGVGGSVIAVLDTSTDSNRHLTVHLGQSGAGVNGATSGWAAGGRGGRGDQDGGAGGGASGLWLTEGEPTYPLLVAGGGGGGGGEAPPHTNSGGFGGSGGEKPGNGTNGFGGGGFGGGGKGGGWPHNHGEDGRDVPAGFPGAGGGGGGGGYEHAGLGGHAGYAQPNLAVGAAGGGGAGTSWAADTAQVQVIAYSGAPFGSGSLTIYPSHPLERTCTDTHAPQPIIVPPDVSAYAVIAIGGAGTQGSNSAPAGTGAIVTGVLDVRSISKLNYWVGCSGHHYGGAGYGKPGVHGKGGVDGNSGGQGGGATALADAVSGAMLLAAGGGGGAGGDITQCGSYPGGSCGGAGGSSGGSSHSVLPSHGQEGGDGVAGGGDGGCANCHHHDGHLSPDGGDGVSPPDGEADTGGGGGGGAGYPAGGAGGHHDALAPGGGGGAGGSYTSSRVSHASISASGIHDNGRLLLIPIIELTTDLTVKVTAVGPAAAYAVAPFTINVHCTAAGQTVLQRTISLSAGSEHEFTDVRQGARCTITEPGNGGASTPAAEQTLTLESTPTTVTMANEFAAGDLALGVTSAVVDGSGDPVSGVDLTLGDLRLAVECKIGDSLLPLPSGGLVTVPGQDTWAAGWSGSIDDLPVGAACAIKETVSGGATSVEYSADGGAPEPLPGETLIAATGSSLAAINHFATGTLQVAKTADGDGTPPAGATYSGTVSCMFEGAPVVFTPALADFALEAGGTATYSSIPVGADCTVNETDQGLAHVVSYLPSSTVKVDADPEVDVTVRNTFQSGSLHVQVGRTGEGSHWANGGYTVQVSCTDGTTDEFTTGPEGGWRSYTPDAGATCTITETADGGATTVTSVTSADPTPVTGPAAVVIPGTGSASVTITNTFQAARLYLDVSNSGPGASYSDGAIVHVEKCEFDGIPFDVAPGGQWNLIPGRAGGIGASPVLPVGAQCDVRMGDDAGGVPTMTPVNVEPSSVVDAATLQVTINDELLNGPSIVEIDIFFALAALDVTVTNEGPGAAFANSPFEVEVTCELDSDPLHGPGGHVTLHFAPDGTLVPDSQSAQLEALPVGAGCAAVETVQGGATEWGTNPPATTVESDGATLAVTNVFATSQLTVTKLIDGNDAAAHADDEFVFDAGCTFNGLPIPPSADVPVTFHLSPNGARMFTLPAGAECTISETHDEHATAVSPGLVQTADIEYGNNAALTFTNTFDVHAVTVEQAVTGDGADTYGMDVAYVPDLDCRWPSDGEQINLPDNGKVVLDAAGFFTATVQVPVGATCGAQEPYGLASRIVFPEPITVALGGEFVLELDAIYDIGQLSVEKDARGNGIAGLRFGFETTCTFNSGDVVVDIPLNEFADEQYELGDGEVRLIEALHGADCTTTEVAAHDPLRVAVEASGFGAATFDRSAVNIILAGTGSEVLVTNFFVGSLPLTGAELSLAAVWLGVALVLAGIVAVVVVRIRRKPVPRIR